MITSLRLLQTKYSLSDEFIANAIRAEIERQALLDIKGVISNASVTSLYGVIAELTYPMVKELGNPTDHELLVNPLPATPIVKAKGNRRGRQY